jgi:TrmH family RNA methyltransferase
MISKNKLKQITSLHIKKNRTEQGLFIAEGEKIVNEIIESDWQIDSLILSNSQAQNFTLKKHAIIPGIISDDAFQKLSAQNTTSGVMAIVQQKKNALDLNSLKGKVTLFLDGVRDPGNFGTIVRIADWFGIENIICSADSVELYNPKTIQATMGSFLRTNITVVNSYTFMNDVKNQLKLPIYGAVLNGKNIYSEKLLAEGIIVLGNESQGISEPLLPFITHKISIPAKGFNANVNSLPTDSLNVSVATAIICGEFARQFAQ